MFYQILTKNILAVLLKKLKAKLNAFLDGLDIVEYGFIILSLVMDLVIVLLLIFLWAF